MTRSFAVAALLAASGSSGIAQAPALQPGDRIRLTAVEPAAFQGTARVSGTGGEALTIVPGSGAPLVIPWTQVTQLAVHERRSRRAGAVHGLKWGLAVGSIVGVISLLTPMPEGEDFSETALALEAVLDGALIGAFVGAIHPARRWRDLSVREAREAAILFAQAPSPPRVPAAPPSPYAGRTPAIELTAGFTSPTSQYAQFPGGTAALAVNRAWTPRLGAALVADADAAILRTAVLGGGRIWVRSGPLFSGKPVVTYFVQLLAGTVRGGESGIVSSIGGRAIQPGAGIDFGARAVAARLQMDYSSVPGSRVMDPRVTGDVDDLTIVRVLVGVTLRSMPW